MATSKRTTAASKRATAASAKAASSTTTSKTTTPVKEGNQFLNSLLKSSTDIKAARAELISEEAKSCQEELTRKLRDEVRDLKRNLMKLTDIYPDSELSLKVSRDDFNAKEWTRSLHDTQVNLQIKEIELNIAENTLKTWF